MRACAEFRTPTEVSRFKLDGLINDAIALDRLSSEGFGGAPTHKEWVTFLLREYYDKMYDFQLSKKKQNIIFEGGDLRPLLIYKAVNSAFDILSDVS